jgi:cytochrome-b5 reductase
MFELSPFMDKLFMQILVFSMSFVSVFYGVQFTKYMSNLYDKYYGNGTTKKLQSTLPLDDFVPMKLIRKEVLSHDTARFTFALPNPDHVLGLPTGQHVSLKYYITEEDGTKTAVQRSYTPVTDNTSIGEFALVIKVYRPMEPKFPHGGKMSQHLDHMKIGDSLLEHRSSRHIAMMAGGTGITPMLQVLHHIFHTDIHDTTTQVNLIYANQTEDDILVRTELETLLMNFPTRFSLWYTIDRLDETKKSQQKDWAYDIGFITPTMIEKHLLFPKSIKDTQFLMCGPPPMIKFACIPALQSFGYTEKDWVIY